MNLFHRVCMCKVFHEAWVDVNEEGTEAAAATTVTMEMKGAHESAVASARLPRRSSVHLLHPGHPFRHPAVSGPTCGPSPLKAGTDILLLAEQPIIPLLRRPNRARAPLRRSHWVDGPRLPGNPTAVASSDSGASTCPSGGNSLPPSRVVQTARLDRGLPLHCGIRSQAPPGFCWRRQGDLQLE